MANTGIPDGTHRRQEYRARLHQLDYFVERNLTQYIEGRLRHLAKRGAVVGDVGCGEQPFRALTELSGATYTGIDVTQNSRQTVETIGSITGVPLPDESFDLILCTEVLEHVSDTPQAFRELTRLVRSGGHILLTVPFGYPLHEEPHDYVRLTEYQVKHLAQECGLQVVEIERLGDELQVLATVWSNMWSEMLGGSGEPGSRRKGARLRAIAMRLPMNAVVNIGSALLAKVLPRKYYLNTGCVLHKPARSS